MSTIPELLTKHEQIYDEVFTYFGYKGNWRELLIADKTDVFWYISENAEEVRYSYQPLIPEDRHNTDYSAYIMQNLCYNICRGNDYTMIAIDTECDGNCFLAIFDNTKELV